MQSSVTERVARSARQRVRSGDRALSLTTSSASAIPKLAIAPMPNVPTTPAARASSVFLVLDPARQKWLRRSARVMPNPLSETTMRFDSTSTSTAGSNA